MGQLRIAINVINPDSGLWPAWRDEAVDLPSLATLKDAIQRAAAYGDELVVEPEAYTQMVDAGVARPGWTPGKDYQDFA